MALIGNTYGKGRVRVMRVHRDGDTCEVRELSLLLMVEGDFARTYTHADNAKSLCTDTMKNLVNIVAHDNPRLGKEDFCSAVADRLLAKYPQISSAKVTGHETTWNRLMIGGKPHPHSFTLDNNGKPFATVSASRHQRSCESGVSGFTFLKATQSGWDKYYKDDYTTLKETRDRLCATSMEATWRWQRPPASFEGANLRVLDRMLEVFATTYSESVQDSLYRMATAALEAVPEVSSIHLACPNKHYIPIDLSPFELDNRNQVFLPTDEPHGQIECEVGRG
jgi:urate oxidase